MPHRKKISNWLLTLPNKITLIRVAIIPLLLLLYPINVHFLNIFCAIIFLIAAITDFFDGFIARKLNMESRLGAILDPIADKILVTATLVLLTSSGNPPLPAFIAALLLCREIAISGLRAAALEQGINIKVDQFGKLKTVAQDIAIFCLLTNLKQLYTPGMVFIWLAVGLSYYSAYRYIMVFSEKFKDQTSSQKEPEGSSPQ